VAGVDEGGTLVARSDGVWCNRQHSRFWFCYSGFDSSHPNQPAPAGRHSPTTSVGRRSLARSSRGLGHHPLKVAARVRIPYGLLNPWSGHVRNVRISLRAHRATRSAALAETGHQDLKARADASTTTWSAIANGLPRRRHSNTVAPSIPLEAPVTDCAGLARASIRQLSGQCVGRGGEPEPRRPVLCSS
jgi:hypothetical protein